MINRQSSFNTCNIRQRGPSSRTIRLLLNIKLKLHFLHLCNSHSSSCKLRNRALQAETTCVSRSDILLGFNLCSLYKLYIRTLVCGCTVNIEQDTGIGRFDFAKVGVSWVCLE